MEYCKENEEMFRCLMESEPWEYREYPNGVSGEVINSIGEIMIQHVARRIDGVQLALVPTLIRFVEFVHDFNIVDDIDFDGELYKHNLYQWKLDCGRYGEMHEELDTVCYVDRVVGMEYFVLQEEHGWNMRVQRIYNYMVAEMVSLYLRLAEAVDSATMWSYKTYDVEDFDKACQIFSEWKDELGIT